MRRRRVQVREIRDGLLFSIVSHSCRRVFAPWLGSCSGRMVRPLDTLLTRLKMHEIIQVSLDHGPETPVSHPLPMVCYPQVHTASPVPDLLTMVHSPHVIVTVCGQWHGPCRATRKYLFPGNYDIPGWHESWRGHPPRHAAHTVPRYVSDIWCGG